MPEVDSKPTVVDLDDMVCFNLHAAYRAVTAAYRPLLEPLGVSYPQYLVLAVLWRDGDVPVGRLVSQLGSDYGTMTPIVKRLEKLGFVTRTRNPNDERSVVVSLTERGTALQEQSVGVYTAIADGFGFTDERADAALEVLRGITARAASSD
ncbi:MULTISPECIES: MarR family winged helix-turn-helix transcriptional regulator [unclassified Leifsonia]|uniref:MarR family winged helix-turn-helix transcriptional regulator n=1 Tax=unclassified Leifsonia TaxID=2663824 RepID=UPI0006F4152B|nr:MULTISPECIES: MarR family transcriptional regulator [unclassified Leifsonia]KQX07691.1 hypothetical protein ASC59_08145 [Leifsonia sp. Root1293]KRA11973.1 hypothetical protein ASD61_08145 [Leifsonia sp. Root60]